MVNHIEISAIDASGRLRPISPDHVALIAASIEERGLKQPIVVRPRGDGYRLTAGGHRLAALVELGYERLAVGPQVIVQDVDDDEARLDEIDENLARHELDALDRAIFLGERKRLYEKLNPETSHGGDRKSRKSLGEIKSPTWRLGFSPRFTADVAERVGLSERTVQRSCLLAEMLDARAIEALRATALRSNQRELLALAEMPAEKQRHIANLIRDGEARTVAQAKISAGLEAPVSSDPQSRLYATLLDAWSRADAATRKTFMAEIGLAYAPKK